MEEINQTEKRMLQLYGVNHKINHDYDHECSVKCNNGIFVGKEKNGIFSYKGIPFALPPTGNLRWKAPVETENSENVYEAYYYGKSPIQTKWPSEAGSYYIQGEDCLTLNIWSNSNVTNNKTVMVFFHGGSYGWGATSDPIYDGHHFVEAHPDIILVTAEYRTGIMGFMDFSNVPGGENFKESGNLGLLDMVCALKWVHKNIEQFGGNKNNVTIFGESAGAGAVSLLPLIENTEHLFNRVIAESGSIALTYDQDECQRLTQMLLKETNTSTMEELMALSEDELVTANQNLNDFNNFPERDGVILPVDLYEAYRQGKGAHVDLMIGTNADEVRYWIREMGYYVPNVSGRFIYSMGLPTMYESDTKNFSATDKESLKAFMQLQKDQWLWNITEFYNEIIFRVPALFQADHNSQNNGLTYVYYWEYPSAIGELGACHAVELAYIFNNLEETIYTGDNINPDLAKQAQQMWVNFAKTGNPSTDSLTWPSYTEDHKTTMILGSASHIEEDWLKDQSDLIEPMLKYNINGCYTNINFKVPFVYNIVFFICMILLLIIGIIVFICVKS